MRDSTLSERIHSTHPAMTLQTLPQAYFITALLLHVKTFFKARQTGPCFQFLLFTLFTFIY
uniref:Uncharacterized protein n=1 Tax=Anguilla anguilla TaxID=7936 RepID=A0A0E9QJG7_ANGAN